MNFLRSAKSSIVMSYWNIQLTCVKDVRDVEMVGTASVIEQYQISHITCYFLKFCSLKCQLHQMNEMLDRRQQLLETCHTVWNELICMYYFSCRCLLIIFCSIFLISKLFRENLFKECGEIVDVRLHTDAEGRFRGFGHVEFATAEAAQNVSFVTLCLCK